MMNNLHQNSLYSLSIQVRLDGLSFFIQNTQTREIVTFEEVRFRESVTLQHLVSTIDQVFKEKEKLQQPFQKVTVVYANELFTVVPKALFNPTKRADYLKFNTKIISTDFVAHDNIDEHELVTVYIPYTNVNNYFFDKFGSFDFYHSTTVFIKSILKNSTVDLETQVVVDLSITHFYIGITKNKKLELINRYEVRTPEDFIYYLLFTLEQLELSTETTVIKITGNISKEDPYYKLLYTYVRHIEILENLHRAIPKEQNLLASLI